MQSIRTNPLLQRICGRALNVSFEKFISRISNIIYSLNVAQSPYRPTENTIQSKLMNIQNECIHLKSSVGFWKRLVEPPLPMINYEKIKASIEQHFKYRIEEELPSRFPNQTS